MSSFAQHTFQGGFILSLPFKLFYPQLAIVVFIIGAISGLLPDAIEFVSRVFFNVNLKPSTHYGLINNLMRWNPSWQLHTLQDLYWHSLKDDDWRKQLNEWIGWFVINPLIIKFIFF